MKAMKKCDLKLFSMHLLFEILLQGFYYGQLPDLFKLQWKQVKVKKQRLKIFLDGQRKNYVLTINFFSRAFIAESFQSFLTFEYREQSWK